jgi:hypothetical protein
MLQAAVTAKDASTLLNQSAKLLSFHLAGVSLPYYSWDLLQDGIALADLCVTGRTMQASFESLSPTPASLADAIAVDPDVVVGGLTSATMTAAGQAVLTRAAQVSAALYGSARDRPAARAILDPQWICVSGEDDPPSRPANVATAPFPQFDITVTVPTPLGPGPSHDVTTRFMVAGSGALPDSPVRQSPTDFERDRLVALPDHGPVFLYVHGHMSRLEEALDLTAALHEISQMTTFYGPGTPCTVVSVDLPNMGYSEKFDHAEVAPLDSSQYPTAYPVLDFIEEFIIVFVESLAHIGLPQRLTAVIGGSLGGHMGLRLSRRASEVPWLARIAAWSPASVWESFANQDFDVAKDIALTTARNNAADPEKDTSRVDYFNGVYGSTPTVVLGVPAQPDMWYRDDWQPCKDWLVSDSRRERQEIYAEAFRQWHWRSGLEMLLYSFIDPDDGSSEPRYLSMTANMLLASGAKDNYNFANIYTATQVMSRLMTATQGTTLFLLETGHSIHNERPKELATGILSMVTGGNLTLGRRLRTACTLIELTAVTCAASNIQQKYSCIHGYNSSVTTCSQTADEGYSSCSATADDGYSKCCDWWPCSWACDVVVWVSNIVCVAWTWISNVVCVAWATVQKFVCTLWATFVAWVCSLWETTYNVVCS